MEKNWSSRTAGKSANGQGWHPRSDLSATWRIIAGLGYVDVSKNRGKNPKMDGENNGKPLLEWMIWGYHYFWKHPCIRHFHDYLERGPKQPDPCGGLDNASHGYWPLKHPLGESLKLFFLPVSRVITPVTQFLGFACEMLGISQNSLPHGGFFMVMNPMGSQPVKTSATKKIQVSKKPSQSPTKNRTSFLVDNRF